jgi:hypothetical protein
VFSPARGPAKTIELPMKTPPMAPNMPLSETQNRLAYKNIAVSTGTNKPYHLPL